MTLSKKAQAVVVSIVVIWLVAIAGLVAATAMTQAGDNSTAPNAGALERNVAGVEEMGLNATAFAFSDIYGDEYGAAGILCAGETTESIAQNFGLGAAELEPLELGPEGIPAGVSYIALATQDGKVDFDKIDSSKVELCQTPMTGVFDTRSMMPLSKMGPGLWALLG